MFKKDLHSKLLCKKCKMNGTKIKQLRKVQECHCRSLNTLASLRGQYTFCKKQQIRRANTEECTPASGNRHSGVTTSYYWPKQARSALSQVSSRRISICICNRHFTRPWMHPEYSVPVLLHIIWNHFKDSIPFDQLHSATILYYSQDKLC